MAWSAQRENLDARTVKVTLSAGSPLSYGEVLRLWRDDESFRRFFTAAVLDSGFEAFFWETPPVTSSSWSWRVEPWPGCGRIRSLFRSISRPASARRSSVSPTSGAMRRSSSPHPSLRTPPATPISATFSAPRRPGRWILLRQGYGGQVVGETMQERVSASPLWLSTAGMGVSWLHLRLDSRPKYYRHRAYAVAL